MLTLREARLHSWHLYVSIFPEVLANVIYLNAYIFTGTFKEKMFLLLFVLHNEPLHLPCSAFSLSLPLPHCYSPGQSLFLFRDCKLSAPFSPSYAGFMTIGSHFLLSFHFFQTILNVYGLKPKIEIIFFLCKALIELGGGSTYL